MLQSIKYFRKCCEYVPACCSTKAAHGVQVGGS